jgi:hypothetical protein
MRERGHPIPVKGWWLRLAKGLIQAESRDLEQLGRDLGKHVKSKKQPFSYSALSNFVLGKAPATVELVEALCKEYSRLPPPVFFPSSYEESAMMLGIAERYAGKAIDYGFEGDIVPLPEGRERRPRRGRAEVRVDAKLNDATLASSATTKRRRARG